MIEKMCKIINNIIVLILIILVCIMFVPKLLGWENLAVLSGSMEPKIPVGSMVIIRNVEPKELEKGDIITYYVNDNTMVTHRVVNNDTDKQEIVTKGDANDVQDSNPVSYENVVGKLFVCIPLLGYLSIYMQSSLGIAIICGVIFVLILLNYLPDIFKEDPKATSEK